MTGNRKDILQNGHREYDIPTESRKYLPKTMRYQRGTLNQRNLLHAHPNHTALPRSSGRCMVSGNRKDILQNGHREYVIPTESRKYLPKTMRYQRGTLNQRNLLHAHPNHTALPRLQVQPTARSQRKLREFLMI